MKRRNRADRAGGCSQLRRRAITAFVIRGYTMECYVDDIAHRKMYKAQITRLEYRECWQAVRLAVKGDDKVGMVNELYACDCVMCKAMRLAIKWRMRYGIGA
jgi:hypothetical protein